MRLLSESAITERTWIRFLLCVNPIMRHQITILTKSFVTPRKRARKTFVMCVDAHMLGIVPPCGESFLTNLTLEGLLICVKPTVRDKIAFLSKLFLTNSTFERFFARVGSKVPLHRTFGGEFSVALRTGERLLT